MSSPAAEMKMWIISVAPMPSMIRMPVLSNHRSDTDFGRNSPADTQRFSELRSRPASSPASAR